MQEEMQINLPDFGHIEVNNHFDEYGNWKCPVAEHPTGCKKCQAFARLWQCSPATWEIEPVDQENKFQFSNHNTRIIFSLNVTVKTVYVFWKDCWFTFTSVPDWYWCRLVELFNAIPTLEHNSERIRIVVNELGIAYTGSPKQIHLSLGLCLHARWCGFESIDSSERPHF